MRALAVVLAALSGTAWAASPVAAGAPCRRIVDARSVDPQPDGSEQHPFRRVADALARSADGDEIALRPGIYEERLVLERAVSLVGPRSAVISAPEGTHALVQVLAPARLTGLSLRGGNLGLHLLAATRLDDVALSGQKQVAIEVESGRTEIHGGEIGALFPGYVVGVQVEPGAELDAFSVSIGGPFRFGIQARGGQLRVQNARVEGPQAGIACVEGCHGEVIDSTLAPSAQGRGAGLVVGASELVARGNQLSRFEQCIAINADSTVRLEDNALAYCDLDGVAAIRSKVVIREHLHVGPARNAAIQLSGCVAVVEEGELIDPGTFGIAIRLGSVEVRGTRIRGARLDGDGIFGDAIFALEPESVLLVAPMLEDNQGSGFTITAGRAKIVGLEAARNRLAGIVAQRRAKVEMTGAHIKGSSGPALVAIEGASITSRSARFESNTDGPAIARCEDGSAIILDGTGDGGSPCVRYHYQR